MVSQGLGEKRHSEEDRIYDGYIAVQNDSGNALYCKDWEELEQTFKDHELSLSDWLIEPTGMSCHELVHEIYRERENFKDSYRAKFGSAEDAFQELPDGQFANPVVEKSWQNFFAERQKARLEFLRTSE
jgi:hypothetical protein